MVFIFHCLAYFRKQPKCPSVNEWIKKKTYGTTTQQKETAWMELESIMLSEEHIFLRSETGFKKQTKLKRKRRINGLRMLERSFEC